MTESLTEFLLVKISFVFLTLLKCNFCKAQKAFHVSPRNLFTNNSVCLLAGTVCIPSVLFHVNVVIDRQAINVRALVIDT